MGGACRGGGKTDYLGACAGLGAGIRGDRREPLSGEAAGLGGFGGGGAPPILLAA